MVRSGDTELITMTGGLTPAHSIQGALRPYLQPIKDNGPKLDFCTGYKRETMGYEIEYMQRYKEDSNTTFIFVRFYVLWFMMWL